MQNNNYKKLLVWQKSMQLCEQVYLITSNFPPKENFGLISQMRRSAISIPSNIAEGRARESRKVYKRFLYIAKGSSTELETQLEISNKIGYIEQEKLARVTDLTKQIQKMLSTIIKKL